MYSTLIAFLAPLLSPFQAAVSPSYVDTFQGAWRAYGAGDLDRARAGYDACPRASPENAICAYHMACVEAASGNADRALEWLERAVDWNWADPAVATWDPDLAPLRENEGIRPVLARMELASAGAVSESTIQIIWDPLRARAWPDDPAQCDDSLKAKWTRPLSPTRWPTISPGGKELVIPCSDGTLRCVDPLTLFETRRIQLAERELLAATFDRAGTRLLVHDRDAHALLLAWPSGDVLASRQGQPCPSSLSPDGHTVVLRSKTGRLEVWTGEAEQPACLVDRPGIVPRSVSWDPKDRYLVVGGRSEHGDSGWIRILDTTWGDAAGLEVDLPHAVICAAFSPDGSVLAVGANEGMAFLIDPQTGIVTKPISHAGGWGSVNLDVRSLAFTPDGSMLLTGTGAVFAAHAWSLQSMQEAWHVEFSGGNGGWPEFSFDPVRPRVSVMCGSLGGAAKVVGSPTGEGRLELAGRDLYRLEWLPEQDRALALEQGTLTLLDGESLLPLVGRVDYEGMGGLVMSPAKYIYVDGPTVRWARVLVDGELKLLEDLAPQMLDPKRVLASSAGVMVRPMVLR